MTTTDAAQRPAGAGTPETFLIRTSSTGGHKPEQSFWAKVAGAFAMFRNGKSITGLAILGVFVLIAIFADVLAPYSPTKIDNAARLQPPSAAHWLGTTHIGE